MLWMGSKPGERWPARYEPDGAVTRSGQSPARKHAPLLHHARELGYHDNGGRESAWAELGSNAQRQLRSRVGGEILDWWAAPVADDAFHAVALGLAGLCEAEPLTKFDGRRAYRMRPLRFTSDSLTEVTWRQTEEAAPDERNSAAEDQATPPFASCLSTDFCGFLGNLPDKAQKLIQEPYAPQSGLTYSYYYEMESELSGTTWYFWCYLADNNILTFCSGQKSTQRTTSTSQSRWKITCYRAAIS